MNTLSEILSEGDQIAVAAAGHDSKAKIPYPQANSLDVVLKVVEALRVSGVSVWHLVSLGLFQNDRQASYYLNAAAFLGFCFRRGDFFYPTELATLVAKTGARVRASKFAALVLANENIAPLYGQVFRFNNKEERLAWIGKQIGERVKSDVTRRRRADSMLSWLAWIQDNLPIIKD